MFGSPETTTGGNALKFYASVRLDIRRIGPVKSGENVIGNRTKVKVVKNKLAPPFQITEFDILYGAGIDAVGDLIDMAAGCNVLEKRGAYFALDGETLAQGREKMRELLISDSKLRDKIAARAGTLKPEAPPPVSNGESRADAAA
jgi:recombination protein RecA